MTTTKLYLVRHGQTEENVAHILQGHMPGTLTAEGRQQAAETAAALSGLRFDAMLSSDLGRCVQTSEIMLERLAQQGQQLRLQTTSLLRERDWGSVTGMEVGGGHRVKIPADAETVEALKSRARIFLDFVEKTYRGKTVLVVSHGLFLRFLQAVHWGVEIAEIERMTNGEFRVLELRSGCAETVK